MKALIYSEQLVLKCCLLNKDCFLSTEKMFFGSDIGKDVFDIFDFLYKNDLPITKENFLLEGYKKDNNINEKIWDILEKTEVDINQFSYYYNSLKKEWAKNRIQNSLLREATIEVSKKAELDINVLETIRDEFNFCLDTIRERKNLLIGLNEAGDIYKDVLLKRLEGKMFFPTGDSYLDSYLTMGFAPGTISILFSATGSGKSSFALNLENKKINKRIPSVYISLENDLIMTMDRIAAMRLNIPVRKLYPLKSEVDPVLNEEIIEQIHKEVTKISLNRNFLLVEEPNLSLKDIELIAKEAKRRFKQDYVSITIDLLSMVKEFARDISPQSIEEGMNNLHEICRSNNIHIFGILQANRETDNYVPRTFEDLDKLRPTLSGIKNSNAWSERSRIVMSLFRKKLYADRFFKDDPRTETMDDILELHILKQNQGALAQLKYLFDPITFNIYRFKENKIENSNVENYS